MMKSRSAPKSNISKKYQNFTDGLKCQGNGLKFIARSSCSISASIQFSTGELISKHICDSTDE